ncbi:hypothetical protein GOBAR_AA24251 [Gossypium barbadense]|uniref:Piwi domain-containing protein n=1 Tax=Gossypium barbadense TaxID=3634 RepID=A0A2P5WZB8_GOSBA|nr:hypothetical protein GOBAR_AA24251 [Gossypium barbadense]
MTETGKNWHKKLPPTLYAYAGANTFNSSCFKGSNHHPWNGCIFGFLEQSDVPSMVSSRRWPLISSYGASGLSDKVDDGIMKEALLDFYTSSGKRKPDQIIIFRDGVSEFQFNQVLIKFLRLASSLTRSGTLKIVVIIVRKTIIPSFFSRDLLTMCYMLHSWGQFMKIRDASETSSSHGGMYAPKVISVPQLSRLKDKVSNFILVC